MSVVIAIGTYNISQFTRLTRSRVFQEKEQDYIEAQKALGSSIVRIFVYHLFPNIIAPIFVLASLRVGGAILTEAALGFLGFGIQPPTPTLGAIVNEGRNFLVMYPWISLAPGIFIMILVIGFNLLGDGLREVLDPRVKKL
jgi:peptide/nickel transport system permease protein